MHRCLRAGPCTKSQRACRTNSDRDSVSRASGLQAWGWRVHGLRQHDYWHHLWLACICCWCYRSCLQLHQTQTEEGGGVGRRRQQRGVGLGVRLAVRRRRHVLLPDATVAALIETLCTSCPNHRQQTKSTKKTGVLQRSTLLATSFMKELFVQK